METNTDWESLQKVSFLITALKTGAIKVEKEDEPWAHALLELPRGPTGLVDISTLTPEALSNAKLAVLRFMMSDELPKPTAATGDGMQETQSELFRLFEDLFVSLLGVPSSSISSDKEIKDRLVERVETRGHDCFDDFDAAAGELQQFYLQHEDSMFSTAQAIGGVKVVTGGQRQYTASSLSATRTAGLYCDTQLIPDPIYPFVTADLQLNAAPLQLALVLYYLLSLRPLIDAQLPVPPVFVFPSFEEVLEDTDVVTQAGIATLAVKVVAPVCDATLTTIDELFDYAKRHETQFLDAITREKLFISQGRNPFNVGTAQDEVKAYMANVRGIRSDKAVSLMEKLPLGTLALTGILERLRPQYHLMENAHELGAQPMLSRDAHWYYFERCAHAEVRELVNERILSRDSLDVMRALQDDSLTWLANIPIEGLVELRRNQEHSELRQQLNKCTEQLASAGPVELESVTREVRHELAVLIQRQQKIIKDIENKYSQKTWTALATTLLTTTAGASMMFMPSLAAAAGVVTPTATAIAGLAGGGLLYANNLTNQYLEKRNTRRSMLGLLATAHKTRK